MDTTVIMKRQGFDKWPSAVEGLKLWHDAVIKQDCVDFPVPIREVVINPLTGGFHRAGKESSGFPATKTAMGHLNSYVKEKPDNLTNNMLALPPRLRAQVWDYYKGTVDPREITLRTAMAGEKRIVRAVVSDSHSREEGDDLKVIEHFREIASSVPNSKLRVIRQWDYTSAELILPGVAVQAKVGVTLYGRISITNSETKGGSYETLAGSMNLVCLNGMVRPGNESSFKVRHMGNIGYKIRQSIKGAIEGVNDHLNLFGRAYGTPLPSTRADILSAFGNKYELPESTVTSINAVWDVDGERGAGDTLAGLVNAVTRFAQSQTVQEALTTEAIAGEVLHKGLNALV